MQNGKLGCSWNSGFAAWIGSLAIGRVSKKCFRIELPFPLVLSSDLSVHVDVMKGSSGSMRGTGA